MNHQEINTAARIVGELRGLSLNVPDTRFAIICDVCALVIERELRDMTREPGEDTLSLEAQRLLADMDQAFEPKRTVTVEGNVQTMSTEGMLRQYCADIVGGEPFFHVEMGWEIADGDGEVLEEDGFDPFGDMPFASMALAERAAREWGNIFGITFDEGTEGRSFRETFDSMYKRGTRYPCEVRS